MNLIDKDILVEYIRQRYIEHQVGNQPIGCLDRMDEDKVILSFLNTLEVKETDLEKEISEYFVEHPDEFFSDKYKLIAKYFFELGLKAQKGE